MRFLAIKSTLAKLLRENIEGGLFAIIAEKQAEEEEGKHTFRIQALSGPLSIFFFSQLVNFNVGVSVVESHIKDNIIHLSFFCEIGDHTYKNSLSMSTA